MKIENTKVYGLDESIIASGYPMSANIDDVDYNNKRAEKLAKAKPGTGHNCYLKGVTIQADITAPQYWWLQYGRYHFADIVSSQSKMHRITNMDIAEQCNRYVDERAIELLESIIDRYNQGFDSFQRVVSNCPMGLNLTARITSNYLQEKTIYQQRKNHKLAEWQYYCDWLKGLPKGKLITSGV